MAENNFGQTSGVLQHQVNDGISSADMDYIVANRDFLKEPDWDRAQTAFVVTQSEAARLEFYHDEQKKLVAELEPLRKELQDLEREVVDNERQQQSEFDMLHKISDFKGELLAVLPDKYLYDARSFLNLFLAHKNDDEVFPWEKNTPDGLKSKAMQLLAMPKLKKFRSLFEQRKNEFKGVRARFDVSLSKEEIEQDIERYYNIQGQKQRIQEIGTRLAKIDERQNEIARGTANERKSLDAKVEKFKSVYKLNLYKKVNYDEVPFSTEKEDAFKAYASASKMWNEVMESAASMNLHFGETQGLLKNDLPAAAVYDRKLNRILCNKSFAIDEQAFDVAAILLGRARQPLIGDYDMRTRYQYELCRQAEKVAKMVVLAEELVSTLPRFEGKALAKYPKEMSAYMGSGTAKEKYTMAFVEALASAKVREEAENTLLEQIRQDNKQVVEGTDYKPMGLDIDEVIHPFVLAGLALINENPEIKSELERIPVLSRNRLQDWANADKDYSLMNLQDY